MSQAKYAIINNKTLIAVLYEDEKLGKVLVLEGEKVDLKWDLEIWDIEGNKSINFIDLKDFLLKVLPIKEANEITE